MVIVLNRRVSGDGGFFNLAVNCRTFPVSPSLPIWDITSQIIRMRGGVSYTDLAQGYCQLIGDAMPSSGSQVILGMSCRVKGIG